MSLPESALPLWQLSLAPSPLAAVGLSVLLALLYVASIYLALALFPLANVSTHDRDHPQVIRRRMLGAVAATLLSLLLASLVLRQWQMTDGQTASVVERLGLEVGPMPASAFVSLVLCATAYLGPLVLDHVDPDGAGRSDTADAASWWTQAYQSFWLVWRQPTSLRNYLVGPVTEELVFRSSVVALWVSSGISTTRTIYLSPLMFALAHVHHALAQLKAGRAVRQVLLVTCAQVAYTTLFGWLAVALLVRTRSVAGPVAAHAFCNYRGFPDFARLMRCRPLVRYPVAMVFVLGLGAFAVLFEPMTRQGVFIS
ncbi:CAAX prenyl protease [Coemansia interrupta]|uniref:intramembrane prenyl-peptidase Rce1 n=1 Tax=Coemansia interrupta TaxID=1126814 RepID=A0A9W8LL92_9FUNG|nr:CAAX prenyl protease [Coemansia interrupta]